MVYNIHTLLQEILTFWHFTQNISLCTFQFPQDWPSHIHCLAVFPRQVPIPVDWLELKNLEKSYHPSCQCILPPSGSTRDPAVWCFYNGICPHHYPYGLHRFAQNILVADLYDMHLIQWLQEDFNLGLFSYLSDLEYMIYEEFNMFLHYPIVMFYFKRFSTSIDLRVKIFGMGHGVMPVTATTTLANIHSVDFDSDIDTKTTMRNQIFFSIRCALKREYFDKFITVHTFLDSFKDY